MVHEAVEANPVKKRKFILIPLMALLLWVIILFAGDAIKGEENLDIIISEKMYKEKDYLASFDKAFIRATTKGGKFPVGFDEDDFEFSIMTNLINKFGIEDVDISSVYPDKMPIEGLYVQYQVKVSLVCPRFGRHFQVSYYDLTHAVVTIKDAKNDETLVVITYDKPYFAGSAYWEERAYQKLQAKLHE